MNLLILNYKIDTNWVYTSK